MSDQHISFTTSKIGSLIDVNQCKQVLSFACTKQQPVTSPNAFYYTAEHNDAKDRKRKCCLASLFTFIIVQVLLEIYRKSCQLMMLCLMKLNRFSIEHCQLQPNEFNKMLLDLYEGMKYFPLIYTAFLNWYQEFVVYGIC